jgi:hypothetical protein
MDREVNCVAEEVNVKTWEMLETLYCCVGQRASFRVKVPIVFPVALKIKV